MGSFTSLDWGIFAGYLLFIVFIGLYISSRNKQETSEDYFLASKSLPWWAIGASLIAANISAEQFIGMSGSGFAMGLAIASYEWMAAITLLIVGKFFLPIFIEKGIYTIPEFVEKRFSTNLKSILAVFWLALFTFVNLTTVLFLGAKALDTIIGMGDGSYITIAVMGLALIAAAYSLYGGLVAVAWTDVVQVVLLIIGGLITTVLALQAVAPDGGGVISGMQHIYSVVPEKFSMILSEGEVITPNGKDAYFDLPGLAVLLGGMWVANIYYWGFNQYIIQRTFAAKSLKESQKGIAFAAFLKLLIPLIVVVPGIVAYVLNADAEGNLLRTQLDAAFIDGENISNDNAAPWLIDQFVPSGMKGLVIAALTAAIISSVASMLNSIATIFTMDIYIDYIDTNASEKKKVRVGRIAAAVALLIGAILAPLMAGFGQIFQVIQEYTGLVSPGILAVFLTGLFWKKTTNNAAIIGALASFPIALFLKFGPEMISMPFMHQMFLTCILSILIILVISQLEGKGADNEKAIFIGKDTFKTSPAFNISAFTIFIVVSALYAFFW